jgi:hypothetical protein
VASLGPEMGPKDEKEKRKKKKKKRKKEKYILLLDYSYYPTKFPYIHRPRQVIMFYFA